MCYRIHSGANQPHSLHPSFSKKARRAATLPRSCLSDPDWERAGYKQRLKLPTAQDLSLLVEGYSGEKNGLVKQGDDRS